MIPAFELIGTTVLGIGISLRADGKGRVDPRRARPPHRTQLAAFWTDQDTAGFTPFISVMDTSGPPKYAVAVWSPPEMVMLPVICCACAGVARKCASTAPSIASDSANFVTDFMANSPQC